MSRDQAKTIITKLVERFAEHRKDYHLPDYTTSFITLATFKSVKQSTDAEFNDLNGS